MITSMIRRHPSVTLLSRMLDGMLDSRTQATLEQHVDSCVSCEETQVALAKTKTVLQGLPGLEENLIREPQTPLFFIPPARPTFQKGLLIGAFMGIGLVSVIAAFGPTQPPLRVISSTPSVVSSSEGALDVQVEPGSSLRTMAPGTVDLEIPDQLLLRLKPGATVTWQQLGIHWFNRRPHIIVNLMRGQMLARTREDFWGSNLEVRTPTANATVKGTAFSVNVDPSHDETTLKVLAGSVFFSPHLGKVGVNVKAGQMSRIQAERLPHPPEALAPAERKALLEAYQIGTDPLLALVIGGGPERTEELLGSATLYVSDRYNPKLQPFLRKTVQELNDAILQRDTTKQEGAVKILEMSLDYLKDPELEVPLRLFMGAYAARLGDPVRAYTHFHQVVQEYPRHSLASVGLAAMGVIAEKQFRNIDVARENFSRVLAKYPKSPESLLAKEFLKKHPSTTVGER